MRPPSLALREIRQKLRPRAEEWAVKQDLALLKRLGLVATHGRGRGARWQLVRELEE